MKPHELYQKDLNTIKEMCVIFGRQICIKEFDVLQNLVDRITPKPVEHEITLQHKVDRYHEGYCPKCQITLQHRVENPLRAPGKVQTFCTNCGQAVEWDYTRERNKPNENNI